MTPRRPPRTRQERFERPIASLVLAIEEGDAKSALAAANAITFLARMWAPKRKQTRVAAPRTAPVKQSTPAKRDPNEGGREVARFFGYL